MRRLAPARVHCHFFQSPLLVTHPKLQVMHPALTIAAALALAATLPGHAAERAVYDSAGKLTGLIHDGVELDVRAGLQVRFEGGVTVEMQPHDQRSPITRDGHDLSWKGTTTFPNGAAADFAVRWTEGSDVAVATSLAHASRWPLLIQAADYVVDVPRTAFVGGTVQAGDGPAIALRETKSAEAALFRGDAARVVFADARANWILTLTLDHARAVTVTDHWEGQLRSFRVRVSLHAGAWTPEQKPALEARFALAGRASAAPAAITVDPAAPLYPFDGFGGNYCWGTEAAVTAYTLDRFQPAWTRHELKAILWDAQRADPGPVLKEDFARIQRIQRAGIPWIISAWRLPERFYTDPNQKPFGTFARQVAADRWDVLLELIGSYLGHLKTHYQAEPDLFSFNEPDLGVNVGFSPEAHREMVKRIGAYLQKQGFKTRMLLGDTANPRDTHRYVLATAADPEAMRHVGALSFHSWGNGTPAQYAAWSEVARWLSLPLLVGEAGVDPGAYRNTNYDSFAYGLREIAQYQDLLRHARPQSLLYWEYTGDYALARDGQDGAVIPSGRLWMHEQLCTLTPHQSRVVATSSDQPDVLVSAFAKDGALVVHVLNTGAARALSLSGLPAGPWRSVVTTEEQGLTETALTGAPASLALPARCLVTLVHRAP
jgi:O-glycosyl hydrolase